MTNYNQDINILTVSDAGTSVLQSSDKAFCVWFQFRGICTATF